LFGAPDDLFLEGLGWGRRRWLSGFWHQTHRSGHPLKKTVVRIPGPS